jgi:hypothetical protein
VALGAAGLVAMAIAAWLAAPSTGSAAAAGAARGDGSALAMAKSEALDERSLVDAVFDARASESDELPHPSAAEASERNARERSA